MAQIHPTAIVTGEVSMAPDAVVGPWCVIDGTPGPVTVGEGSRLLGQVWLNGPLSLGTGNVLYPGARLGFAPQSVSCDPQRAGPGVRVGDRTTFREGATVHRAMTDDGPTTVGSDVYLMTNTHVGHDSRIDDRVVIASGTVLGGHVIVEERATVGGNVSVHQFVRIGRGAMLSGAMGITCNLPPFFMLTGTNVAGAVNVVGMRRMGMSPQEIEEVRWVFRTLYRLGLPLPQALSALRERADRPLVAEYVSFIESSRRPLCHGAPRAVRGDAPAPAVAGADPPVVLARDAREVAPG
jgi:UDP-N-acetylglucosamine acyltransferase